MQDEKPDEETGAEEIVQAIKVLTDEVGRCGNALEWLQNNLPDMFGEVNKKLTWLETLNTMSNISRGP